MWGERWTDAWLRVKALVNRRRLERDLEEELQFHLSMREEKNRALGLAGDDARAAARRRFGNVLLVKEDCREVWTFTWIETIWQDLRYAVRGLVKSPGFVVVVVLSLALGIGGNTTIFSVMNSVMLQPLPYEHSERLTTIWPTRKTNPDSEDLPPLADIFDWKKQSQVFDDIAAVSMTDTATLTGAGEPGPISVQLATENLFSVIGVQPALGRVFRADEGQEQVQTVVISNNLWQRRFNGDPSVLGKKFRLEGVDSTVVGVMPAGFESFGPWYTGTGVDLWEPANPASPKYANRSDNWMMPVARLKPGITLAQAQLEIDVIARGLEQAFPETNKGVGERVVSLYDTLYSRAGDLLYPLLGAVGFVLLIGCVNVANLIQSRAESRRKEYSLRESLGAGRLRLMQQLLVESGLLTFIGASLGVALSFWAIHLFRVFADLPHAEKIHINAQVLLFTVGISVVTSVLVGLVPAIRASRPDLNDGLREGESTTVTGTRSRTRHILVIVEVALAMVLLVGAGLTMNGLLRILLIDPGFEPKNVLTMGVNFTGNNEKYVEKLPGKNMDRVSPEVTAFHQQLIERVKAMPGVESVGMISIIPPLGAGRRSFSILGHPAPSPNERPEAGFNEVSPSYFQTMRIPLKKGRYLNEHDTQNAPWVVVISETLANRYFPNEDPVGQKILLRYEPQAVDEERPREIVGMVGEVKQIGLGGLHPLLYESYRQQPQVFSGGSEFCHLLGALVIRTNSDVRAHEADLTAAVKQAMKEMDSNQPVTDIATLDQVMWTSISSFRFNVFLLGAFSIMAVLLAAIGVYGVLSYSVNQRTREMGIRLALGAQRSDVLRMVGKLGLQLSVTGVAIGLALAFALNQFMAHHLQLYRVTSTDPWTYSAVSLVLMSVALFACYLPARRATNVDPMAILRHE